MSNSGDISPSTSLNLSSLESDLGYHGLFETLEEVYGASSGGNVSAPAVPLPHPENYYTSITSTSVKLKRFILIRHGETEANKEKVLQGSGIDLDLNEEGKRQASVVGKRLSQADIKADLLVCSNLRRAKETSDIISNALNYKGPTLEVPDLTEISWGIWEGTPETVGVADLLNSWQVKRNFDAKAPSGESPNECLVRIRRAMMKLLSVKAETILVVSHGRLLRVILSFLLCQKLDNMHRFKHKNTCINVIDAYGSFTDSLDTVKWVPLLLNDHAHIEGESTPLSP
jgi:probable phosphoglycerate mutase